MKTGIHLGALKAWVKA